MNRRWDTDIVGHGIGSAVKVTPAVEQLLEAMRRSDWVTEEPEAHLLPHITAAVGREGAFRLESSATADVVLVVQLAWLADKGTWRDLEVDVYRVIASFAENSTFIRKTAVEDGIEFEVTTGVMDGDGPFATHGHTVRLRISGPRIAELRRGNAGI